MYLFGCASAPPQEVEVNIGCLNWRSTGAYDAQHTHLFYRSFEVLNIHIQLYYIRTVLYRN